MYQLKKIYEDAKPKLKEELGLANVMELPKLEKEVISIGAGEGSKDTWHSLRTAGYQRVRIDGATVDNRPRIPSSPPRSCRCRHAVQ